MTDYSGQYFGRYYLAERLGEGGMAVVYKAYDTRLERAVAIKIIRREAFSEEALEEVLKRFEREAKSLAKLSHPNIVKVYDFGEHQGSPYLVMEYLPGGTLKKTLGKPVPWQDAVKLVLPVAHGVAYAHQRGVLHRDIKPANVLITESGEPMLSDFGIAKMLEGEQTTALTGSGMAIGTPEYMAPEQWAGTTSPFSDQYSLGVVLYEMIAGRKPYEADTPGAILIKQVTEPLPSPSKFVSDLPEPIENVLIKVLARETENRYEGVDAFIDALNSLFVRAPIAPVAVEEETVEEKQSPLQVPEISMPPQLPLQDSGETSRGADIVDGTKMEGDALSSLTSVAQEPSPIKFSRRIMGLMVGVAIFVLVVWLGLPMIGRLASPEPIATVTVQVLSTEPSTQLVATETLPPALTPTRTLVPTLTPIPSEITDSKGVEMVLVPSNSRFEMGVDGGDGDERPPHMVFLDTYYIDKYEVTNALYKMCVETGACKPPTSTGRYNNSQYAQHPVVYVDWNMSQAYCEWRDARLPTEAEWEKASRGTDGREYPWGWTQSNTYADFKQEPGDTKPVGSYPQGVSPYGAYDMAGNIYEWVADWYSASYYVDSPAQNPLGPESGEFRVLRGGTWCYDGKCQLDSTIREGYAPSNSWNSVGFRCARFVPVETTLFPTGTTTPDTSSLSSESIEITDIKGVEMVLVPEGEFTMGSDTGVDNEKPAHQVYLDAYYIDKYEVTNALYKICVEAGVCSQPVDTTKYNNSQYAQHPVAFVSWYMAKEYCEWRGARLSTEAEWEKAARGTDGRTYPWGEEFSCLYTNFLGCVGDTTPVGSYEKGVSPYGAYDMIGNVEEWVADKYDETYYVRSPRDNPLGPENNAVRVLRGGSWYLYSANGNTTNRYYGSPVSTVLNTGFRCAKSVP